MKYQVIVGNIGTVYDGNLKGAALGAYKEYCRQSETGYGRAAGESVVLYIDGEYDREFIGDIANREIAEGAGL